MEDIRSEFRKANKLIEEFFEKNPKFKERYTSMLTMMNAFIKEANLTDSVTVNELVLAYALVDYFEDIMRLKEFHNVEHVNNVKIVSYTSYWLLHAKPLQVTVNDNRLVHINERFVLSYILTALENEQHGHIMQRENQGLKAFAEQMLYFLKYRGISAQSIEMTILAFFAGRIYQELDIDISSEMGKLPID